MKNQGIRLQPEERKAQILKAAAQLFDEVGYDAGTIEMILEATGLSKGALYHHFASKEAILEALVLEAARGARVVAEEAAGRTRLNAAEKLGLLLSGLDRGAEDALAEGLHRPENASLHARSIAELVRAIAPSLATVIREGEAQGLFRCERALETAQLLLSGGQFLLDDAFFRWTGEERRERMAALQTLCERSLGASAGSLSFIRGLGDRK
jgi:AcrR family transcriptional regulator